MAKLTISTDLATEHLDLLEAAGFENDRDLLSATPEAIHRELVKANDILSLAEEAPTIEEVEAWVDSTREGGSPAARKAAKRAGKRASGKKAAKKVGRKPPRKIAKQAAEESAHEPAEAPASPADEGDPADPKPDRGDVGGETPAPEQTPGELVNFEDDPDVREMLERAPVALPIPNRQLAEVGIRPSEIEVAPVLSRADSDLEVSVTVGRKSPEPASMPRRRPSGIVQVADFRAAEKRGIDTSRVRRLEDAAADQTPVVKPQLDERTRLIRTAREKTNRGKDPNSRRFVRGVLHDRRALVFFGCVIVILFQLSIPLAVIASPLLILSQDPGGSFTWVPVWMIAFPIAVPVLAILYFSVSFRVKCRVCAQRVLTPRQCLKHRKSHHIPLLGHILPLALHVLTFKWFNCTYCGTAVRIKE